MFALFAKTATATPEHFLAAAFNPRVIASYKLTFGASLIAALINTVFGFLVAWCLIRYRFPGRKIVDALVDLPFAIPTSVSGIALTAVYAKNGWVGQYLYPLGIKSAFSPFGICIALTFIRFTVCGTHAATSDGGLGYRDRRGRGLLGCQSLAGIQASNVSCAAAGVADWLCVDTRTFAG